MSCKRSDDTWMFCMLLKDTYGMNGSISVLGDLSSPDWAKTSHPLETLGYVAFSHNPLRPMHI